MDFDIAVIGGGPAGYTAALRAAQSGARVVLFEKQKVGGTCLNVGCIPTKLYVSKAELIEKIRQNTVSGIFKEAGLFSFKRIYEEKERAVKKLTGGISVLLKQAGVEAVEGEARFENLHTVLCGDKKYNFKNAIIATGSANCFPPVPGADGTGVLDSTGALALKRLPKSVVVIGTGVIGLEFTSILQAFGCETTSVDILPRILPGEEPEAADIVFLNLQKKGVRFCLGAEVLEIRDENGQKCVEIKKDGEQMGLKAETVLIATGRKPENHVAKELGLELDPKGFIVVDEYMKTSCENIYAAGDVTGNLMLAHSAYMEAETAARNCLGGNQKANLDTVPRCIFSMPQLAAVGLTEEQAIKRFDGVVCGSFPFSASGKAIAMEAETGFVKAVAQKKTGKLVGCTIVGADAAELIHIAAVAIGKKATIDDFEQMVIAHPTLAECVKEAVLDCAGKAVHLPVRKKGK